MVAKYLKVSALRTLAILALTCVPHALAWATGRTPALTAADTATQRLHIQVGDRGVAALMHGVPDVYVSGVIDPDAPTRFLAMVKSGQIPSGSNVYLNSPGGSLAAGLALGRLFRAENMTTFIGIPPFASGGGTTLPHKSVMCASACAYAYLGGTWRWAPATGAPFGVHQFYLPNLTKAEVGQIEEASGVVVAYLHEMDINPDVFTLASTAAPNQVVWLNGRDMLKFGIANNGVGRITAEYKLVADIPYLIMDQPSRDGEHKIVILCAPADVTLDAFYIVGHRRAEEIVKNAVRAYFSLGGGQHILAEPCSLRAGNSVSFYQRRVSKKTLGTLVDDHTIGAWVDNRNGLFRTGFTMDLSSVRSKIQNYYENCIGAPIGGVQ